VALSKIKVGPRELKVTVKGYGDMKRFLGVKSTIELEDGARIGNLISALGGKVRVSGIAFLGGYKVEDSTMIVLVNGRNIHALDGYDTVLKDGDLITFMPVLIGG
jgi:molybdopterin converting factor small subunit